jgi:hypothetical protein
MDKPLVLPGEVFTGQLLNRTLLRQHVCLGKLCSFFPDDQVGQYPGAVDMPSVLLQAALVDF